MIRMLNYKKFFAALEAGKTMVARELRAEGAKRALRASSLWNVRVRNRCFVCLAYASSVDMTPDKAKARTADGIYLSERSKYSPV